ncbi:DNA replication complex GINS protein PSF3 [Blattella germanica]|nr:DNA replication complex GINS protein PSF3 [Blattella germanica]
MKSFSYLTPHYFSIDDIFATQERLPCKIMAPLPRLGFLDPSSDNVDLVEGLSVEFPLWLGLAMSSPRRYIASVDIPKMYKEAYREILKADPSVVDLHKLCLYFYQFGTYISRLDHRESTAVGTILVQTFKDRFRQIMDWAQNSGTDPTAAQRLDSLEKMLFREGHEAQKQLDAWLNEGSGQITAADMVINHKKRKRAALDDF